MSEQKRYKTDGMGLKYDNSKPVKVAKAPAKTEEAPKDKAPAKTEGK